MNQEIKLTCPWCKEEFKTKIRKKIWCSPSCSRSYSTIKHEVEKTKRLNEYLQQGVKDGTMLCDDKGQTYRVPKQIQNIIKNQ